MPNFKPHIMIDEIESKFCTKCQEYHPLSDFIKSSIYKDGLGIYCTKCRKIMKQKDYESRKEKYKEKAKQYYYDNHESEVLKRRVYREENIDAINAQSKQYRDTHKDQKAIIEKKYREENKEQLKAKVKIKCSDPLYKLKNNARNKKYTKTEKGIATCQISRQRYRNKQTEVSNTLTKIQWNASKEYFNNTCAYCGKVLQNLTQDHFIPLSLNGGYDVNNIIPCCKSCNSSKQNNDFCEWYSKKPYYSETRKNKILSYLALFK